MELIFLGVGEACDSSHGNTSLAVRTADDTAILLDCGFTVPHRYFHFHHNADELDIVWISHFHGDHFCGLPLLLLRFFEMGRSKPLIFLGHTELKEKIPAVMETAYPGFFAKLTFPLKYRIMTPEKPLRINNLTLEAAATDHSRYNLSLGIDDGRHRLFYSGDGRPTAATEKLAAGCDLVVHEAFQVESGVAGHGSVQGCLDFAASTGAARLALVHIERHTRKNQLSRIHALMAAAPIPVLLPEEDFTLVL